MYSTLKNKYSKGGVEMKTLDWFFLLFCIISTIVIFNRFVFLINNNRKRSIFPLLVSSILLIGALFIITNDNTNLTQRNLIIAISTVVFFLFVTSIVKCVSIEERERDERRNRCIH
jgi:NADH:ubiquinone oxidoreductase subunit 6 (subunit J)